jgi:hypothetical protein
MPGGGRGPDLSSAPRDLECLGPLLAFQLPILGLLGLRACLERCLAWNAALLEVWPCLKKIMSLN